MREEVGAIRTQTGVIDANADEIIRRAPQVSPLAKAIKKANSTIKEEAKSLVKNIKKVEDEQGRDWFKLIFLLAVGLGGVLIGYMGFKVAKWKTSLFGGVMCLSAISMNFYWHLIERAFLPIVGGGFAIVLCIMYVHYYDQKRASQDTLKNAPTELD